MRRGDPGDAPGASPEERVRPVGPDRPSRCAGDERRWRLERSGCACRCPDRRAGRRGGDPLEHGDCGDRGPRASLLGAAHGHAQGATRADRRGRGRVALTCTLGHRYSSTKGIANPHSLGLALTGEGRRFGPCSAYQKRSAFYPQLMPSPPTIAPVLVAELLVEGERMPVYVHVIDHPDARVLVDTGMTELHPAVADMDPRLFPLSEQAFDLAGIDLVVSTHLHFDHCGGNHLFAGTPIYVQRRELDDALGEDDYTIREWVEARGVQYVPVDGEHELLPGLRLVPAPGHTPGSQMVVVETGGRPVIVGGDVAVSFDELDEPTTEGQLRVRALDPELVWLAHEHEAWRPR